MAQLDRHPLGCCSELAAWCAVPLEAPPPLSAVAQLLRVYRHVLAHPPPARPAHPPPALARVYRVQARSHALRDLRHAETPRYFAISARYFAIFSDISTIIQKNLSDHIC